MRNNWIKFLVAAVVGATLLLPTSALAVCVVTVTGPLSFHDATSAATVTDPTPLAGGHKVDGVTVGSATPNVLNAEGNAENISNVVISDDGAGTFCFGTGQHIILTLNGVLTSPGALTVPANIDIYDSNGTGGLTIGPPVISSGFAANTTQTVIDITIQQNGTVGAMNIATGAAAGGSAGAVLRVKNLRVDVTQVSSTPVTLTVSATSQTVLMNPFSVGTITTSITSISDPTTAVTGQTGAGTQSSGAALTTQASFTFTEGFGKAFRVNGTNTTTPTCPAAATCPASGVANDITTNSTSLIFNVTGIPSGVTVTFPGTINTSAAATAATGAIVWTARAGDALTLTATGASGSLTVRYDTTTNGTAAGVVRIDTAPTASFSGTGACVSGNTNGASCNPKIGVTVGGTSAAGTATLSVGFGPSLAAVGSLGSDDTAGGPVAANLIPRYSTAGFGGSSRVMFATKTFFVITPTRTVLLYATATTNGGFNTGLSVANTGLDVSAGDKVFTAATAGQTGGLKFYFFNGLNGDTFTLNTDTTACTASAAGCGPVTGATGLSGSGQLAPGSTFTGSLDKMLIAAGKPAGYAFSGYIICAASFNFGHGLAFLVSPTGASFSTFNAQVMGAGARGTLTSANGETFAE